MFGDLTNVKAFDEGAATESVQARARESKIHRGAEFGGFGETGLFGLFIPQLNEEVPAWSIWPARRDAYLRRFWKSEPMAAGSIYSLTARIKSLDRKIESRYSARETYYEDMFADAGMGEGFEEEISKFVTDWLTTDNGGFLELIGAGNPLGPMVGPVQSFAHMDSANRWRSFDPEYPVVYRDPETGQTHLMHFSRVAFKSSMPQPNELARGIGFCPLSRAISIVQNMKAVHRYKLEKITGSQTGIGYGNGFNPERMREAIQAAKNEDVAEGLIVYKRVPFLMNPDGDAKAALAILSLAGLPDGFDFEKEVTLYIYALALCFGVDAREFWPATASGATKADATIQHLKAQGKGIGDLISSLEWIVNKRILPKDGSVTFEYDFTDDEQDRQVADLQAVEAETLNLFKSAGAIDAQEMRTLAIAKGLLDGQLIPEEAPEPPPPPPSPFGGLPGQPPPAPPPPQAGKLPPEPDQSGAAKAIKDFADVREGFVDKLTPILQGAVDDELTRRAMAARMRSVINKDGLQAFIQGLSADGKARESLAADELKAYREWQGRQSEYVTAFGEALFKDGLDLQDVASRVEMWANKSIGEIYHAGLALSVPLKQFTWRLGATEKHCPSCSGNAGKTKTMKEWEALGLPQSDDLDCGGFHCACGLDPA